MNVKRMWKIYNQACSKTSLRDILKIVQPMAAFASFVCSWSGQETFAKQLFAH